MSESIKNQISYHFLMYFGITFCIPKLIQTICNLDVCGLRAPGVLPR